MAEPSITTRAESNKSRAAAGSLVDAATPRAAWASVFRAWAVSRAATPGDLKEKSPPDFLLPGQGTHSAQNSSTRLPELGERAVTSRSLAMSAAQSPDRGPRSSGSPEEEVTEGTVAGTESIVTGQRSAADASRWALA